MSTTTTTTTSANPTTTATKAATATTDDGDGDGGVRHPVPVRPDDDAFVGLAADVGAVAAAHAAEHDRDASFVTEAYAAMRANGYLCLAVPSELGGLGASMRQVCYAQAELARHDGATALASTMHLYITLMQGFRRRLGAPDAEGVLRRVVEDGLVLATSGGSDWLWPSTVAVDDGTGNGYLVSGRKAFCSQSPEASVVTTSAVLIGPYGEPGPGSEVLHFAVPLASEGVRLEETWDTLGMRGTASHDLVFDDVPVPNDRIVARRPWGEFAPPIVAAALHIGPVASATYFGIAAQARDVAVADATAKARGTTPFSELARVQRQVGLMDAQLSVAWWALLGALDQLGDDYGADGASMATVMLAKRQVVTSAIEVVNLAIDLVGGRAYFKRSPLERAYRDVRAGTFHPLNPEITLTYAGKVALGLPLDTE